MLLTKCQGQIKIINIEQNKHLSKIIEREGSKRKNPRTNLWNKKQNEKSRLINRKREK